MADEDAKKRWLPLEANPEVMNQFVQGLGLTSSDVAFHDVYGFDDDLLAMVPTPVLAVLLLFPITKESEAASAAQQQKRAEEGSPKVSENIYFMKQTVGNACGTIGILHALGNNKSQVQLEEGSFLEKFFRNTETMSPGARAGYLENAVELEVAHSAAATAGDTLPPDLNESVDLHFVCFVCIDDQLYELDGRKSQPIRHGLSKKETVLKDAVKIIQEFIARNPQSNNFNVIALAQGEAL